MYPLTGKSVFIAGATSGIGRTIATQVAEAGANLLIFGRRTELLDEAALDLAGSGPGQVARFAGDATNPAELAAAVLELETLTSSVDIVVNCVGTNLPQRALTELTFDSWRHLVHTNLDAAFFITHAVLPSFRRQGDGLLIHISSSAAKRADRSGVGYQASKAGVAALANATMEEERANGVRVSVVFPGMTDTPFVRHRAVPPSPAELAKALKPEDVAQACVSLMTLRPRAYVPELVLSPTQP